MSSYKASAWAWELDIPTTEKIVLLALAQYVDEQGRCYPSQVTLMRRTGLSRSSMVRSMAALEGRGLIVRREQFRTNGGRSVDLYTLKVSGTIDLTLAPTVHSEQPPLSTVNSPPYPHGTGKEPTSKNQGEEPEGSPPSVADKPQPWEGDEGFKAVCDAATGEMRKRSLSRAKTYPVYRKALKAVGGESDALLAALREYIAHDPDVKRTGGPGLHIWLRDGRWDHWLGVSKDEAVVTAGAWSGPAELFVDVVGLKGLEWASSWLGPCGWSDTPPAILARTGFARDRIEMDLRTMLREKGIRVSVANTQHPT